MTAFQIQTYVPADGSVTITLPERFREKKVKLSAEPERQGDQEEGALTLYFKKMASAESMSHEEFSETLRSLPGILADLPKLSEEEYLTKVRSLRGILSGPVDYSDLREETDREL
jgi:hypothetical protein